MFRVPFVSFICFSDYTQVGFGLVMVPRCNAVSIPAAPGSGTRCGGGLCFSVLERDGFADAEMCQDIGMSRLVGRHQAGLELLSGKAL